MKSSKNYAGKKLSRMDVNVILTKRIGEVITSLKKELPKFKEINSLILFGSFARGDYSLRHSDLDLMVFLDKPGKDKILEEIIRKKVLFLSLKKGVNVHSIFQYQHLEEEDKSLMLTLSQEGQVLFSRKSIIISRNLLGLKEYYLVKFETEKVKQVEKNKLQRFLHGYKIKKKRYRGLIDEEKVFSAGKGAILAPGEFLQKILLFSQALEIKAVQKGKFYR